MQQGQTWVSQNDVKVRIEDIIGQRVIYRYVGKSEQPNSMPVGMFKNYFRKA